MKEETASWVVNVDDFYAHGKEAWEKAHDIAAHGMIEPLQTRSYLTFCRQVDPYGQPMDSCQRSEARFAVASVTCKDLGSEADLPMWEPLCSQRRPSTRGRRVIR